MVRPDATGTGHSLENPLCVVPDRPQFAMAWYCQKTQLPAEGLDDSLKTKAHAELWNAVLGKSKNGLRDAEIRRTSGSRRMHDQVRVEPNEMVKGDRMPVRGDLRARLAEVI